MQLSKYKLGELLDVSRGASLSGEFYSSAGELIRLTLGHFDYQNGGFKENTSKDNLYFVGPVKSQFILNEGDIITPLTEQTPGLLGSTAMIPKSEKYIQSQDVALIRCKEDKLDPMFCYYLLPSKIVKSQLGAAAQQTKIRHTTPDRIKDVIVFIPELEEQRRIGVTLHSIDRKIALNREINRNLEAMVETITDFVLASKPTASKRINQFASVKAGGDCPKSFSKEYIDGDLIPIYSNGIVNDGLYGYTADYTKSIQERSVTVSARGTIGASFIRMERFIPIIRLIAITPNEKGGDVWIHQMIKRMVFENNGSVQQQLTVPEISKFIIPYPQEETIAEYERMTTPLVETIFRNQKEISDLQKQRDELLPLLMNGQVSVMPTEVNCDLSHD